jgi:hypothetical protein
VLKDRTWAVNGRTFRWLDKTKYETGGFRQVCESIRPHFDEVQATIRVSILAGSSQSLISDSGDSEFYHQRQRKEAVSAEIIACLDLYFAGLRKEEVQLRLAASDLIWGVKSKRPPTSFRLNSWNAASTFSTLTKDSQTKNSMTAPAYWSRSPSAQGNTTGVNRRTTRRCRSRSNPGRGGPVCAVAETYASRERRRTKGRQRT